MADTDTILNWSEKDIARIGRMLADYEAGRLSAQPVVPSGSRPPIETSLVKATEDIAVGSAGECINLQITPDPGTGEDPYTITEIGLVYSIYNSGPGIIHTGQIFTAVRDPFKGFFMRPYDGAGSFIRAKLTGCCVAEDGTVGYAWQEMYWVGGPPAVFTVRPGGLSATCDGPNAAYERGANSGFAVGLEVYLHPVEGQTWYEFDMEKRHFPALISGHALPASGTYQFTEILWHPEDSLTPPCPRSGDVVEATGLTSVDNGTPIEVFEVAVPTEDETAIVLHWYFYGRGCLALTDDLTVLCDVTFDPDTCALAKFYTTLTVKDGLICSATTDCGGG